MLRPISVIIPTMNRHNSLVNTINSLLSGDDIPSEIIVIDQSPKPYIFKVKNYKGCSLKVIHLKEPSSTKARNIGLDNVSNDTVLFCDDDILVNHESIKFLWKSIKNEDVALVAGIHYKDNNVYTPQKINIFKDFLSTLCGLKKFWRSDGYIINSNFRGRYSSRIKICCNTDWAMGYFFCIRKSISNSNRIKFDENLKKYAFSEDLDFTMEYCRDSKKEGYKTIIVPDIYVNHLVTKEWRIPKNEELFYFFANRKYLLKKHFPKRYFYYKYINSFFDWLYYLTIKDENYSQLIKKTIYLCKDNIIDIENGKMTEVWEKNNE